MVNIQDKEQPPIIRFAIMQDALAMARIQIASWQYTFYDLLPSALLSSLSEEQTTSFLCSQIRKPNNQVYIAIANYQICGYLICSYHKKTKAILPLQPCFFACIESIYVANHSLRQGIGRALLSYALDKIQKRNCVGVDLWVAPCNHGAIAFYKAHHFCNMGDQKIIRLYDYALLVERYHRFMHPD